jgi:hypothetical protein
MLLGVLALIAACAWAVDAPATTPYAGQQARSIKSLSEQDVEALLAGQGAGFARAAELNGYPGPAHVLELADTLGLTERQRQATQAIMNEHRARARQLGAELVAAEAELDRMFQQQQAAPATVDRATATVAALQGRLRAEHLKTHLAQAAILDRDQIRRYAMLRGYAGAAPATDTRPATETPSPHQHQGSTGSRP